MAPEQPPRRRRGLPRTTQDQQPTDEAAPNPAPAPNPESDQNPEPAQDPAPAPNPEQTAADTSEPSPADQPARRTGLNQQPARRTGMGTQPRRTGMAHQSQTTQQPESSEQAETSQPDKPRRMGMTQQPDSAQTKTTPAQQTTPTTQPDSAQPPKSQPAKSQASQQSQSPKSQRGQKTFLGRTGRQWAIQGGIGVVAIIVVAAVAVLLTQWLLGTGPVAGFVERYPGQYSQPEAPGGYPWWLNWAHFFNAFLMVLVIKTGIQIRTEARPAAYWTPKWNKKRKISLTIWLHNALDLLWVLNGVIFVILLLVTGYWQRVVPTSWDIFPNALSAGLQYASLDWPTVGDWAHYNSLQELAYFTTIFIAAPLAILTGLRMSGLWPTQNQALNKLFPVELARAVHFPVMIYFTVFILVHLILVFATDALANLNQIYTGDDAQNWTGFWLFALSLAVMVAGAFLARALFAAPIASLFGRVGR